MHCQEKLLGAGALALGRVQGDQYVEIRVTIPTTLTESQHKLLEEWEEE
jgi:DnaJ-class molecular chaperone